MKKIFTLILLFTSILATAQLIPIPGLFNTGLDNNSYLLSDGATDPHYLIVSSADINYPGPNSKVVLSEGFPMNCWIKNTQRSKWIAPRTDAGEFNEIGVYVYRITFDLSAFKSHTAIITGIWTTDNNGVDILVNGKSTGYFTPSNAFSFGMFPFEINKGFVDRINTIDFAVYNLGAPTGLRVEITGKAEPKEYVYNGKISMIITDK